jgi:hypothetical protein
MPTLQSWHGQSGCPGEAAEDDIPSEMAPREPEILAEDVPPETDALVGKIETA